MTEIRCGFTADGFVVVDDETQTGEFAYYSSPYWERACRNPEKVAAEMLAKSWKEAPAHIKSEHYRLLCEALERATRMRTVTVHFEDGKTITTSINGTDEEIIRYYVGNRFQFGDTEECPEDKLVRAVRVEFHDSVAAS